MKIRSFDEEDAGKGGVFLARRADDMKLTRRLTFSIYSTDLVGNAL